MAPVVTTTDTTIVVGESVAAASLFSGSDADGDSSASYEFWDEGSGGGYFSLNGVQQGVNLAIAVSAADLANTPQSVASPRCWCRERRQRVGRDRQRYVARTSAQGASTCCGRTVALSPTHSWKILSEAVHLLLLAEVALFCGAACAVVSFCAAGCRGRFTR